MYGIQYGLKSITLHIYFLLPCCRSVVYIHAAWPPDVLLTSFANKGLLHVHPVSKLYHICGLWQFKGLLQVLDESAFALCKENRIPVVVFNLHKEGNIVIAAKGCSATCTVVDENPDSPEDCLSSPTTANGSSHEVHVQTSQATPGVLSLLERKSQTVEGSGV